jgi:hypothetical protein
MDSTPHSLNKKKKATEFSFFLAIFMFFTIKLVIECAGMHSSNITSDPKEKIKKKNSEENLHKPGPTEKLVRDFRDDKVLLDRDFRTPISLSDIFNIR